MRNAHQFESFHQMLSVLVLARMEHGDVRYPDAMVWNYSQNTAEGTKDFWTVNLADSSASAIELACGQIGAPVSVVPLNGTGMTLEMAVASGIAWTKVDPVQIAQKPYAGNDGWSRRESGWMPNHPDTQYVLATRGPEQAQRLVNALAAQCAEIQARAFAPSSSGSKAPYDAFWTLDGNPSLETLKCSAAVWWGPRSAREALRLFYRWPYIGSMSLRQVSQCCKWGHSEPGVVLMGPGAPRWLRLRHSAGDGKVFLPVPDFAELSVGQVEAPEQLVPAASPEVHVHVTLKLITRPNPEQILEQRQRDLVHELESIKIRLAAKERQLADVDDLIERETYAPQAPFEPLYVYHSEPDAIPLEIQRLLIEWLNSENDLEALCYLKVNGECFGRRRGTESHILTTASALGWSPAAGNYSRGDPEQEGLSASTLGLRLMDYKPSVGGGLSFLLSPRWAKFQTRLFLPHHPARLDLDIYPRFPDCEDAAEKLAAALCPPGKAASAHCFLLRPGPEDDVHSVVLPLAARAPGDFGFRPLLNAFKWDCSFKVTSTQAAAGANATIADVHQVKVIESRLEAIAAQRAGEVRQRLEKKIVALDGAIAARQTRVTALSTGLTTAQSAAGSLIPKLTAMQDDLKRTDAVLKQAQMSAGSATNEANRFKSLAEQLIQAQEVLSALRVQAEDYLKK